MWTRNPRDRACPEGEADLVLVGAGRTERHRVGGRGSGREARETQTLKSTTCALGLVVI